MTARDIFATQILGSHVTSCNQGLSSNDQRRQRRESLGKRFTIYAGSVESRKEAYKLHMGHLVIIIQGLKRELLNISVVQSTRNYKTALMFYINSYSWSFGIILWEMATMGKLNKNYYFS